MACGAKSPSTTYEASVSHQDSISTSIKITNMSTVKYECNNDNDNKIADVLDLECKSMDSSDSTAEEEEGMWLNITEIVCKIGNLVHRFPLRNSQNINVTMKENRKRTYDLL